MSVATLLRAVNFAAEKHINQRRKNATQAPYINHPLGVATILSDVGVDDVSILVAAVLHDTVEDTGTSFTEIEQAFGKEVCEMVREVTDDKSLPKEQRKRLQVQNAAHKSPGARLIKIADKIHNLEDIIAHPPPWSVERIQGYFVWSSSVVLGLHHVYDPNSERLKVYDKLSNRINRLFSDSTFTVSSGTYPTIPPKTNLSQLLESYYESMRTAKD